MDACVVTRQQAELCRMHAVIGQHVAHLIIRAVFLIDKMQLVLLFLGVWIAAYMFVHTLSNPSEVTGVFWCP